MREGERVKKDKNENRGGQLEHASKPLQIKYRHLHFSLHVTVCPCPNRSMKTDTGGRGRYRECPVGRGESINTYRFVLQFTGETQVPEHEAGAHGGK